MQWPIQDAKARFSELLKECMNQGPQIITKHGTQMAVLIPIDQWLAMTKSSQPNIKDLLISRQALSDHLKIPQRGKERHRKPSEI